MAKVAVSTRKNPQIDPQLRDFATVNSIHITANGLTPEDRRVGMLIAVSTV
jgi:hypothetical protein